MTSSPKLLLTAIFLLATAAPASADDWATCAVSKLKVAKTHAACRFGAEKTAARRGGEPDVERCIEKLSQGFVIASKKCGGLDHDLTENDVNSAIADVSGAIGVAARSGSELDLGALCGNGTSWDAGGRVCVAPSGLRSSVSPVGTDACAARKIRAAQMLSACGFSVEKKGISAGSSPDMSRCSDRLEAYFASVNTNCPASDSELDQGDVEYSVSRLTAAIGRAALDGVPLSLAAYCGAGTSWSASTFSCTAQGGESSSLPTGLSTFSLSQFVDGAVESRRFQIHAPDTLEEGKIYPVVFAFHGNGGTGDQFVQRLGAWVSAGDFVGVYPDGMENSWNLGPEASHADDVEFVEAIAAELAQYAELDTDQMFAMGNSNGAAIVHRLAIETDLFRGIGAVVTSLLEDEQPRAGSKSVRVIQVLGTADHLVPYGGGIGVLGHEFMDAEESAAVWAAANSCTAPGTETITGEGNIKIEYAGCVDGGGVVHYGIVGGGHGLPRDTEGGVDALIVDFFFG